MPVLPGWRSYDGTMYQDDVIALIRVEVKHT